jgi:hypothetical protein
MVLLAAGLEVGVVVVAPVAVEMVRFEVGGGVASWVSALAVVAGDDPGACLAPARLGSVSLFALVAVRLDVRRERRRGD